MLKVNYHTKTSISVHLMTENVGLFVWFVQHKLLEGPEIQSNRASFVSMEKRYSTEQPKLPLISLKIAKIAQKYSYTLCSCGSSD